MRNGRPRRPPRVWRKNTGPGLSRRIAAATASRSGARRTRPAIAPATSSTRLAAAPIAGIEGGRSSKVGTPPQFWRRCPRMRRAAGSARQPDRKGHRLELLPSRRRCRPSPPTTPLARSRPAGPARSRRKAAAGRRAARPDRSGARGPMRCGRRRRPMGRARRPPGRSDPSGSGSGARRSASRPGRAFAAAAPRPCRRGWRRRPHRRSEDRRSRAPARHRRRRGRSRRCRRSPLCSFRPPK